MILTQVMITACGTESVTSAAHNGFSAVFDAVWNIKPRLFGLSGVANPRDSYGYRCGLRLAQTKNPPVLFVPSSIKHCTSAFQIPTKRKEPDP